MSASIGLSACGWSEKSGDEKVAAGHLDIIGVESYARGGRLVVDDDAHQDWKEIKITGMSFVRFRDGRFAERPGKIGMWLG